jgi:catechol 2,3-dioxygenase
MSYTIPPQTRIGHVHLKVSDLDRALSFYKGILGFELTQKFGDSAAFISAGGYHHHIGLNTWFSKNAPPPPPHSTGLYHTAVVYPTRRDLAAVLQRLIDAKYPLTGTADHGVSEALYLDDPDGNGVELYWDKPKEIWPYDPAGNLQMVTEQLDIENLLEEIKTGSQV